MDNYPAFIQFGYPTLYFSKEMSAEVYQLQPSTMNFPVNVDQLGEQIHSFAIHSPTPGSPCQRTTTVQLSPQVPSPSSPRKRPQRALSESQHITDKYFGRLDEFWDNYPSVRPRGSTAPSLMQGGNDKI
jgi:hypothetical protein